MNKETTVENTQRVAIYVRVSTHWQIDKDSLKVQKKELAAYAELVLGIPSYEIFEDPGFSAKNTDRPAYQRMMARLRTGEFSHLLVWKIDRISRNLMDFSQMYAELKKIGVTFVSKNEQFDTSTAIGEAMLKIILVFAELERNMTSERVSAVMLSRANSGQWNGGRIPFGYDYDKSTKVFTINKSEAETIRRIYDLYDKEHSLIRVAAILNESGKFPRSNADWNATTVRNILTNPFYVGTYRYNRHGEAAGGLKQKPESEWIYVENHHEPIIEKAKQDFVVELLKSKHKGGRAPDTRNRVNVHIFAGLLVCGNCGSIMNSSPSKKYADGSRRSNYICPRKRTHKGCDNKYVTDYLLGPFTFNYIANIIKAYNSFGKSTSMATLEKKLLRGEEFSNIDHIQHSGLKEMYDFFKYGAKGRDAFSANLSPTGEDHNATERELLLSENRRLERALNRLKSIYLYAEEEMSEKDYYIQKKEITDALEKNTARLTEIEKQAPADMMSDEEFIEKASYFIMASKLQEERHIDFRKFYDNSDPKILKNFVQKVVSNFCIKNGRVESITFKNGICHEFVYKESEQVESLEPL